MTRLGRERSAALNVRVVRVRLYFYTVVVKPYLESGLTFEPFSPKVS